MKEVDPDAARRFIDNKPVSLEAEGYFTGIREGNRTLLSRAITLIESQLPDHQLIAQEIVARCLPFAGKSIRIGITGVPGVGKSSFIESLGALLMVKGHKLAVLAIDPSSEKSGGSILGDKTRMETLGSHPNVFIRPSPSAGSLGGVARKTRETVFLCEAAGFDIVFIETVGVGQSETAVHSMVDLFLLLMLAGAGDELQGIKRGIMEMADIIAITKSDGANLQASEHAMSEFSRALHLFPPKESGWSPIVMKVSAHERVGLAGLWNQVIQYMELISQNGYLASSRESQASHWLHSTIKELLLHRFYHAPGMDALLRTAEREIKKGTTTSFSAAAQLLDHYSKSGISAK